MISFPFLQITCSEPLTDMLINETFNWLPCPYAIQGPGVFGTGMVIWFAVFVMMANNSEGLRLPLAWTILFAPIIFISVPGVLVNRLLGVITLAVAAIFYLVIKWLRSR